MNKYTVKATVQILAVMAFATVCALVTAGVLQYFEPTPTQLVGVLVTGLLGYVLVTLVKIQASILESRDKLNGK